MVQSSSRLTNLAVLVLSLLALLACGISSTVGAAGGTSAAATATLAPTATPTLAPTATPTPTPGHMLVTVHPNSLTCSGSGCNPYVCHDGMTCHSDWSCLTHSWPTVVLSNSGQASLSWTVTITEHGTSNAVAGWSASPKSGTLAGDATKTVSFDDDPSTVGVTDVDYTFKGAAQKVIIELSCGIG
jgi:hypothetical protein